MLKIIVAGPRPHSLGADFGLRDQIWRRISRKVAFHIQDADLVMSGGAIGVDLVALIVAHRMGKKTKLFAPYSGQEREWPPEAQRIYFTVCRQIDEIFPFPGGSPDKFKPIARNRRMLEEADRLVAVDVGSAGTKNIIEQARTMATIKEITRMKV